MVRGLLKKLLIVGVEKVIVVVLGKGGVGKFIIVGIYILVSW